MFFNFQASSLEYQDSSSINSDFWACHPSLFEQLAHLALRPGQVSRAVMDALVTFVFQGVGVGREQQVGDGFTLPAPTNRGDILAGFGESPSSHDDALPAFGVIGGGGPYLETGGSGLEDGLRFGVGGNIEPPCQVEYRLKPAVFVYPDFGISELIPKF